ncbi:hypothetical protein AtNW77_Chr5g0146531 [Arabidopsis thaliana]|uniref:Uncharacterized protein n=2 Tax=Arabidopsis thaliana TaxID=3702 RepID=A0A654GCP3_ARATH|nr:uncharacterized protein AT5G60265 [Arabidopsis thaliana]ANM69554.1 hypothetical protein AT5G60265 [Arabidopsis thaliana]CAA0411037.1 unnamed protein product [Arabidopsis thaliana]VYS70952.1 unnamed protein product [Arabidopsis thaliana]|eukprot:NP_001331223.1 hypothetical protein AT5G60265 [Arabidopsis thaliana]
MFKLNRILFCDEKDYNLLINTVPSYTCFTRFEFLFSADYGHYKTQQWRKKKCLDNDVTDMIWLRAPRCRTGQKETDMLMCKLEYKQPKQIGDPTKIRKDGGNFHEACGNKHSEFFKGGRIENGVGSLIKGKVIYHKDTKAVVIFDFEVVFNGSTAREKEIIVKH